MRDKLTWFVNHQNDPVRPFETIKDTLIRKRLAGCRYVTFTGGEPMSHPDFIKIMALSKKLGYRTGVNSNMTYLADKEFSRMALPYIDEIVASVHGHNSTSLNSLVGVKNGFQRMMKGIENLERHEKDIYFITDTVILSENIGHLKEIIEMVSRFKKLRQMLFSNVNLPPESTEVHKKLVASFPEIKDVLPMLHEEVVVKRELILGYYGLPFCILGEYSNCSSDIFFEVKDVVERMLRPSGYEDVESNVKKPTQAKKYSLKCKMCIYRRICGGYFKTYDEIYKDTHIEPVLKKIIP